MAALETTPVGGRRFHDEWLSRHLESNSELSNIYSIHETSIPRDEDGPFEYVDDETYETYETEAHDMMETGTMEVENEEISGEHGLLEKAHNSVSAAPAMDQETSSSPSDDEEVYSFFERQFSKLNNHCDKQLAYNSDVQKSIKRMAGACEEINGLKAMIYKLQEQVADLQSQVTKPSIAVESTEGRKRGRTRRSSPA